MTNDFTGTSNWTLATGTKPGERHVYWHTPPNPAGSPAPARSSFGRPEAKER